MNVPYIFNIQKFSVHDGPGIRTTVFFKGCPLKCLWCHNPESQNYQEELAVDNEGKKEILGKQYSITELVKILQKDHIFYDQSGGGVTFSGGEVMTQNMDYVVELAKALHRLGISVAIDTCGYAPNENFARVLPYTDLFLYDLKLIQSKTHKQFTGVPNELILENLKYLSEQKANVFLRLILLKDVNTDISSIEQIKDWLKKENISVSKINLLPYHDFGRDKYQKLQRECTQNFEKPTDEDLAQIKTFFEQNGYSVTIGG